VYHSTYFEGTRNLLAALPKDGLRKILLISSTSVYAATDGAWVDETTDPMAGSHDDIESRENAKVMLAQEELVLKSGHPAVVFRLSGIYGPGRNRIRPILEGRLKPSMGGLFMNRIHAHDLVRGARLLLERGQNGEIYLGADDAPCTQKEFYGWLYERLSLTPPAQTEEKTAHGSNKRVSNQKIKSLGLKLRYPTYKEGYEPLIAEALARPTDAVRRGGIGSGEWISR
jgi:nucleoside-diphosphate-sugar epimerase